MKPVLLKAKDQCLQKNDRDGLSVFLHFDEVSTNFIDRKKLSKINDNDLKKKARIPGALPKSRPLEDLDN